ncbi:hypothetical protein QOZ80_2BG0155940 [Eleusine coracana subsp. coracana]|nr:hypothetical protein QOZ80_2BG0155940 [Eleusine coracana subsp. coracana]
MAVYRTTSTALAVMLLSATMAIVAAQAARAADTKGNGEPNKTTDLVVEACKNMSNGLLRTKVPHFDEEPCVSALRSDKRSAVAKDHGDLTMVAFDLLDHRVNNMRTKIGSMLHNFPVHSWPGRAVHICAAGYVSMTRTLPVCRDIFLDLKPLGKKAKDIDSLEPLLCLHRLAVAATDCNKVLLNWQYPKSTDEFSEVIKYIGLTWGLMELATDCKDDSDSQW